MSSESVCEIVWRQVIKLKIGFTFNKQQNFNKLFLCLLMAPLQPPLQSKKRSGQAPFHKLEQKLRELVENGGEGWTEELRRDLPHSFQRHGDLILLGDNCFTLPQWNTFGTDIKRVKFRLITRDKCKH